MTATTTTNTDEFHKKFETFGRRKIKCYRATRLQRTLDAINTKFYFNDLNDLNTKFRLRQHQRLTNTK